MFLIVVASYCSRDQGDCLRWSLFLCAIFDLKQDSRQSSYVIVYGMWCQWWSIAFLTLTTYGMCLPTQSKDEQDWTSILIRAIAAELLGMKCGPLCSSIFPICPSPSAVSVGIWIPSSASTPQVGFLWSKASPIQEERLKFQLRRRREVEVPCSGVPVVSLAGSWDGCGLWEINSRVWNGKELKRLLQMFETQLDCQLVHVLMFVVVLVSLSLLLNMIWFDTRLWITFLCDCLCMWLSMECDVNDGALLFSPWRHMACAYLLNQRMNRIEHVSLSWQHVENFYK